MAQAKGGMSDENAHNVVRSWFEAVGAEPVETAADLLVQGTRVRVVRGDVDIDEPGSYALHSEIASPDVEDAIPAFRLLALSVGASTAPPVDRGPVPPPGRRDYFYAIVRHTEFRHAPDLPPAKLEAWRDVVEQECSACWWRYRSIMCTHGYEIGDLRSFALAWACIFAHKGDPGVRGRAQNLSDSAKMLRRYLRQRFTYLIDRLARSLRDAAPAPHHAIQLHSEEGEIKDAYAEEEEQAAIKAMPRTRARALLAQRLAALPHDSLISALQAQIDSDNRDHATKHMARVLLRNHRAGCATCGATPEQAAATR